MSQIFNCPACGAALDYDGGEDLTVRCDYCGSSVIVPEVLRRPMTAGEKPKKKAVVEEPFVDDKPELSFLNDPDYQAAAVERVKTLLQQGQKVEAVKVYRSAFDCSLTEARTAVQQLEAGTYVLGEKTAVPAPDPTVKRPKSSKQRANKAAPAVSAGCGCFTFLVVGVPILIAILGILEDRYQLLSFWGHNLNPFSPVKTSLVFGEEGAGPGLFTDLDLVTADGEGYMYVTNGYDSRIQRFDPDGNYVSFWVINADTEVDSIAATQSGLVYVLQDGNIYQYQGASGELIRLLEYGGPDGYFEELVATADNGVLILADFYEAQGWVRYDENGRMTQIVKSLLSSSDEEIDHIAMDGIGNVYGLGEVSTRQGWISMVFVFDANGGFITRFGSEGEEEGQFSSPGTLAVDNQQRIYVSDSYGMLVFDGNGRYLHTFSAITYTNDMEISPQNQLYFVESYYNKIIRYDLK